jgi:hypothetical protein
MSGSLRPLRDVTPAKLRRGKSVVVSGGAAKVSDARAPTPGKKKLPAAHFSNPVMRRVVSLSTQLMRRVVSVLVYPLLGILSFLTAATGSPKSIRKFTKEIGKPAARLRKVEKIGRRGPAAGLIEQRIGREKK